MFVGKTHGAMSLVRDFSDDASGFANPAVWTALVRKGLARTDDPTGIHITATGMAYDTGGVRLMPPPGN